MEIKDPLFGLRISFLLSGPMPSVPSGGPKRGRTREPGFCGVSGQMTPEDLGTALIEKTQMGRSSWVILGVFWSVLAEGCVFGGFSFNHQKVTPDEAARLCQAIGGILGSIFGGDDDKGKANQEKQRITFLELQGCPQTACWKVLVGLLGL